mmetsp:Transcript_28329/g.68883  ORF Transcript_28329/g.68883 Transcript_28329/m.68883 type:complete len:215 (+) Transcript_28329:96-740(+)
MHVLYRYLALILLLAVATADEATCNTLRSLNTANIGFAGGDCACSDPTTDTTKETCSSCFQSTTSTAFKGIATSTATKDKTGTSFSQRTDAELCFQYENEVYSGASVCYSYFLFGANPDSQCTITVDGTACNQCQTFTKTTLSFDCSNLNYNGTLQNKPIADAVQDTVLQFLTNTESSTGCAATGGGGTGSSSGGFKLLFGTVTILAATFLNMS